VWYSLNDRSGSTISITLRMSFKKSKTALPRKLKDKNRLKK
jgi:hypothetical protein